MKTAKMEVTLVDSMGSDLSVVNAARVSFHKESTWLWDEEYLEYEEGVLKPQDAKLINYLAKHKHTSPFNHSFITVRVKAPIFVARQLVKHKFMPWNEVSRRYVDEEPEFYFPLHWRAKAENVKQGSIGLHHEQQQWHSNTEDACRDSISLYNWMIADGVCAEQARMILPQNTMTEWIWSGTLGAFADMLKLRLDSHTQAETREVAQLIYDKVLPLFPVSLPALLGEKE